jgi:predicted transcriptional regulator
MKQQGNCSPSKINSTTKNLNNSNEEETSNIEFQKIMVRMTNELKEENHKLVTKLKEDMNKPLKELKENSNRWMKLTRPCRI